MIITTTTILYVAGIIACATLMMYIIRRGLQIKMIRCAQLYNFYRVYGDHKEADKYRSCYLLYEKVTNLLFGRSYRSRRYGYGHTIETGYPSKKR